MNSFWLVLILTTSPTVTFEVGFSFSSLDDCEKGKAVIVADDKSLTKRLHCLQVIEKKAPKQEKKPKEATETLKGRQV